MDVTCSDPFVGSEKEGKNNFSCEKNLYAKDDPTKPYTKGCIT